MPDYSCRRTRGKYSEAREASKVTCKITFIGNTGAESDRYIQVEFTDKVIEGF